MVDLVDTAGCDSYSSRRDNHIKESDVLIYMFSVTSRHSFEYVESRINEARLLHKERDNPSIIVIGNKIDEDERRQISLEEGHGFARRYEGSYFEISVKLSLNVDELFCSFWSVAKNTHLKQLQRYWEAESLKISNLLAKQQWTCR